MTWDNFFHHCTETTKYTFEEVINFIHKYFIVTPSTYQVGTKHNTENENQNSLAVLLYAQYMNYTIEQCLALYAEHHLQCLAQPDIKKDRNIFQLQKIYRKLIKNNYDTNITITELAQPLQEWSLGGEQFMLLPKNLFKQK
jgi:glycosidase